MNFKIVARLLSFVVVVTTALFGVSMGFAAFFTNGEVFTSRWLACICMSAALATTLYVFSKNATSKFTHRESLACVGLSWVTINIVGALPYLFFLKNCSLADAIFETTSGFTSTGFTVFHNLGLFNRGLMFYRCLTQWIGGIGVVIFVIIFTPLFGVNAKLLGKNEMSVRGGDMNFCGIKPLILGLLGVYAILSIACCVTFLIGGMSPFDAICHMMAAVSTGGFSTHDNNFGAFSSPFLRISATIFMALGGLNFVVLIHLARRKFREFVTNEECKYYLWIITVYGVFIAMLLYFDMGKSSLSESFIVSFFHVVSVITTTGFSTTNLDAWLPVTHVLFITLMLIGGCSGSTAGGIKVSRVVIAGKACAREIETAFRPNIVRSVFFNKNPLNASEISSALMYMIIIGVVAFIGLVGVVLLQHKISFVGVVSAVFGCLGNVGLGMYEFGAAGDLGCLTSATKYLLSILMLVGRVEFYAIAVLFVPSFWRKNA